MKNKEEQIRDVVSKILRLANKLSQVEKQSIIVAEDVELTTKEIHTIQAIGECDKINISEVGLHFGVTKGAASQMVSRLVKRGFVRKRISSHSNKEFELSLTESGWGAFKVHENLHGEDMSELICQINAFSFEQIKSTSKILGMFDSVVDMRLQKK